MTRSSASEPHEKLPLLLEKVERREKTARRRAILYSLLPVILTVVLLTYTARSVHDAQQQVAKLQTQLDEAQKKLAAATDLGQYVRPLDYRDIKFLASRFPGSERLLVAILELRQRGVGWKLGGQNPQEGFDSPSFVMYILRQLHAPGSEPRSGETEIAASRRLFENLPQIEEPQTGDLILYPNGYALFYFASPDQGKFVLGMTPFGITALKPDFAKPVGYRHVQWH